MRRFLLIALIVCGFSAARADQSWIEVQSPHFTIATDGGEKRARDVATRFEQMRMAFGVLFQKVNVNTAPLEIIAFRNNKELRQFAPLYGGKPIEVAGFFLGDGGQSRPGSIPERQYIALDLSAEDNWGTVFHEYAHLLINANFPPSPVWFDEGFAEYCSSLRVDKKEIALGLVKPELPQLLNENRWLKLLDLFSVEHDSKIYNRDDRRSVFYAQSWVTVHYFMSKNMMKQVSAYTQLTMDQHVPIPDAIRRAFGMEPEALEKAIEGYLRSGSVVYFHTATPPGAESVTFTSHPLNDLDVKTVMADLDFHARDYRQRGITEFQEVLSKQPENVVANRGLGYEALQHNDWDKAGEYFKRAAAQDVKDPQVHYLLAFMLNRNGRAARNPEDLETIKKELNTAIALDENFADAYSLLGLTLSFAGEKDEAVKALVKAVVLSPRNSWYSANLANVYLQQQDFEHAIPLLQELEKSSEPQISAMAAQQLQQVEAYQSAVRQHGASAIRVETSAGTVEVEEKEDSQPPEQKPITTPPSGPVPAVIFMRGTLVSVDCSSSPAATLTISAGGKKWKMLAPQAKKLVVMGADELSCSWANRKVAVNYRKNGADSGTLVSLELE
jgi:tetratricopeptide (TPR) repeat protein